MKILREGWEAPLEVIVWYDDKIILTTPTGSSRESPLKGKWFLPECPPLYKKRATGSVDCMKLYLEPYEEGSNAMILVTIVSNPTYKEKVYRTTLKRVPSKMYAEVCFEKLKSKWNKKKDRDGWSLKEDGGADLQEPMLLHKWDDWKHTMVYPALLSPKLNGVRATYKASDEHLLSRKRNIFNMPSLLKELKRLNVSMDGELWSPDYTFEEIVGIIKAASDPRKDDIQYWVFDRFTSDVYIVRLAKLIEVLTKFGSKRIYVVPCIQVNNEEEVDYWYELIMQQVGVDGVVVRTMDFKYIFGIRSKSILKKRPTISHEFKCVGYGCDVSVEFGKMLTVQLVTEDNQYFMATPSGTHAERAEMHKKANSYDGTMWQLEFSEWTTNGLPKHIKSCVVRDYE